MFCSGCGYALSGLAHHACPECGREFNSRDPATYSATPGPRASSSRKIINVSAVAWPCVVQLLALGLLVIARLELGRWPHRLGMDDPKGIPVVSSLMVVVWGAALLMPVSFVATLALVINALFRRSWRTAAAIAATWLSGVALLYSDVAHAWTWFMD